LLVEIPCAREKAGQWRCFDIPDAIGISQSRAWATLQRQIRDVR
jgi:hypothetical protein